MWNLLSSKAVSIATPVIVTDWMQLSSVNMPIIVSPMIVNWVQLDSRGISIIIPAVGWAQLDSRDVAIVPSEISTEWVLLNEVSVPMVSTEGIMKNWLPWIAGAGAVGLAIFAITRRD